MHEKFSHSLTFRKAKEMDKNKRAAAVIRTRYLDEWIERYLEDGSDVALYWMIEAIEEKAYLTLHSQYEYAPEASRDATGRINDEMIERAKAVPVTELIDFSKGKALAFCHEDKRPSLSLNKKNGNAWCFVCNRGFNAIDVHMERDGYSFKDAVLMLGG